MIRNFYRNVLVYILEHIHNERVLALVAAALGCHVVRFFDGSLGLAAAGEILKI